jgi:tripartite-type tricarboxylate transporter receptor subunit TctC
VNSGRLRPLAVTSPRRLAAMPNVPTLAEAGVGGFQMKEWEGLVAPAGTPPEIIAKWNRELARIIALPDVVERLAELGMTPAEPNAPQQFGALVRDELQHWTRFVKDSGIKAS